MEKERFYKLVKLSASGEKIGYFNNDIDPEDSYPTMDVDEAQILSSKEAKSMLIYESFKKQTIGTTYTVQKIEV